MDGWTGRREWDVETVLVLGGTREHLDVRENGAKRQRLGWRLRLGIQGCVSRIPTMKSQLRREFLG